MSLYLPVSFLIKKVHKDEFFFLCLFQILIINTNKETSIENLHKEEEKMCNDSVKKFKTLQLICISNLLE